MKPGPMMIPDIFLIKTYCLQKDMVRIIIRDMMARELFFRKFVNRYEQEAGKCI